MTNIKCHRILKLAAIATCFLAWTTCPVLGNDVTFDWAIIGNPGNAADSTGFGSVGYTYRISKYEVTNSQYAIFLNAVATTDTHGLYDTNMGSDTRGGIIRFGSPGSYLYIVKTNMGNKPVNYISFLDAMRFTNWLHNGQGAGDTETGAYTIGNGTNEVRQAGAMYFIPSEDEWYKAAFHMNDGVTGNYWQYATRNNLIPTVAMAAPNGDISNPGSNVANYALGANWNGVDGNVTTVGSAGSASAYGTFDQAGNVYEWNEALLSPWVRGLRGVSWINMSSGPLAASNRCCGGSAGGLNNIGFRVASQVP